MILTCFIPLNFAVNTFDDPADRAVATAARATKSIAHFTHTGTTRTQNLAATVTLHERRFVDPLGQHGVDLHQPLRCSDSFMWQGGDLRFVGRDLACRPETAIPLAAFALPHRVLLAVDAPEILGVPDSIVVWMLAVRVREVMSVAKGYLRAGPSAEVFYLSRSGF